MLNTFPIEEWGICNGWQYLREKKLASGTTFSITFRENLNHDFPRPLKNFCFGTSRNHFYLNIEPSIVELALNCPDFFPPLSDANSWNFEFSIDEVPFRRSGHLWSLEHCKMKCILFYIHHRCIFLSFFQRHCFVNWIFLLFFLVPWKYCNYIRAQ